MSERIRVALVITELRVGGAERCLVNLAVGLDPTGYAATVYSLGPRPEGDQDGLVRRLDQAGIPVQFLDAESLWHAPSAIAKLRRHFVQQSPQVIQSFLFHANVVGTLAARGLSGTRLITGVRVADPSRGRQWLERALSRWARQIVCVSQSVAQFCREEVGLPADKLVVIPNGIDTTQYPASRPADLSEFGVPTDRRVAVCVGRLHRQKGLDWLLKLTPNWLQQLPLHDLLMVGDGPQRQELQQLAASLGIAQRVHFAGWRPDVPEILASADMLLLPSRWEGMPNVLLEAMASARPVLATRTQGVAELLGPGTEDQSVASDDAPGFVDKLVRLVDDRQAAAELGQCNRDRVAQHFSLRRMINAYQQLYTP